LVARVPKVHRELLDPVERMAPLAFQDILESQGFEEARVNR